ncbi:MAG: rRNA pseudouridine synthase [Lachnospiraceae bacterium]|nr:rRNA pseudouridine synthase [Lachnospiraceae bacterium]
MRLDKLLSDRGYGTRKEIKKLLSKQGAVVNGAIVKDPGYQVQESDAVTFQGEEVSCEQFQYYLFHKPAGCVCANEDHVHQTIFAYVPNPKNTLFSVGRLDLDTEGLLLVTNDGKLAHALLSPRRHVDKVYFAKLDLPITDDDIKLFSEGVDIGDEKLCMPADLARANEAGDEIRITIKEGRFHQVKRMFEAVGKEVLYLKRESMGPFTLDDSLPKGVYRTLTEEELSFLETYTNHTKD